MNQVARTRLQLAANRLSLGRQMVAKSSRGKYCFCDCQIRPGQEYKHSGTAPCTPVLFEGGRSGVGYQEAPMTPITHKLVLITTAKFRGTEIIIELHAAAIFIRTKESRESFPIPYTDLYEIAAMRHAKRVSGFAAKPRTRR